MKKRENNKQKIKIMKVKPSKFKPFSLVTDEKKDNKVVIVVGNVQASPLTFDTEEEAEAYLTEQPYEMFTNLYVIFKYYENENKKQNPQNVEAGEEETI